MSFNRDLRQIAVRFRAAAEDARWLGDPEAEARCEAIASWIEEDLHAVDRRRMMFALVLVLGLIAIATALVF